MDIPNAIRAQYDDIIAGRKGFDGQVRDLGDGTYIVTGLVWEARVKTPRVNNSTVDEVHIMHCNGFFDGTSERVGESTLWIFDCRNCGHGKDGIWEEADYKKAMDRVQEWMEGGPRWNAIFLYPEGDETAISFLKMLQESKELYAYRGSWTFSEETRSTENTLKFEGQRIKGFQSVADIVVVLICPTHTNPNVNILRTFEAELPLSFQDYKSKWAPEVGDSKRRTLEEIAKLVKAYLPEGWMLVLCGLGAAIPAICVQGFIESRILTVDNSNDRDRALSAWVMEHRGARITYLQEREDGTDSGNHTNLSDDDEIGYKGAPELERTTTSSVQTELPQHNDEGVQIMETVVTHKQNTEKQSNEHSQASTAVQIVRSEHGLTTIPVGGEGLSVVLLAMKDRKEKERKRRQPLEQALSEQFSIDKEMEQSVDKGCRGVLDISKDPSAIDTVPKKARSQRRRKTIVPDEGARSEEIQATNVSTVQASANVNMVLSNPL